VSCAQPSPLEQHSGVVDQSNNIITATPKHFGTLENPSHSACALESSKRVQSSAAGASRDSSTVLCREELASELEELAEIEAADDTIPMSTAVPEAVEDAVPHPDPAKTSRSALKREKKQRQERRRLFERATDDELLLSEGQRWQSSGHQRYVFAPSFSEAESALQDITSLIRPYRGRLETHHSTARRTCRGRKKTPFSGTMLERMLAIQDVLTFYTKPAPPPRRLAKVSAPRFRSWQEAGTLAAIASQHGHSWARKILKWTRTFIADRSCLPFPRFGAWNHSLLKHGKLATDLLNHLQSVGKYVKAQDIVDYLALPETKERHAYDESISLRTAQRWMLLMNFRWKRKGSGQYEDGHERLDVVLHRQDKFLPKMAEWMRRMRYWKVGDEMSPAEGPPIWPLGFNLQARVHAERADGTQVTKRVVVWFHDESTFYQNDRRHTYWIHDSAKHIPQPKGEGVSCMAADFVSADYGWLKAPPGSGVDDEARILFKAGKNRDGYFTNDDVLEHATRAMDLLEQHYPDDQHVFVYDNATTHTARPANSLSARSMTLGPSAAFKKTRAVTDENGKPVYNSDGKRKRETIQMANTTFNGSPQSLYFPDNHAEFPGQFKGIAQILRERGDLDGAQKKLQCNAKFDCADKSVKARCCARRILYNHDDFRAEKSALKIACEARGFEALFLPKFHPELSFIEQCWGAAKRVYREFPLGKTEEDLEANVRRALDSIPLVSMRR
jgi:hypothetical protein